MFAALFVMQLVVGGALSMLLIIKEEKRAFWPLHIAGISAMAALFALMVWASGRGETTAPVKTLYFVLAGAAYLPFLALILIHYGASLMQQAKSQASPAVPKTYAGAQRAEQEGDLIRAAKLYRRELEHDPKDVEARRRLAEILVKMNHFDQALGSFRLALTHIKDDPRSECAIIFRIADILVNKKLDFDMALQELDFVRKKYPDSRYARVAQTQLEKVFILKEARDEREKKSGFIPDTFDV